MNSIVNLDSGLNKTLAYIKKQGDGYIFDTKDLNVEGVTYTSKRTILVRLCDDGVIKRVCRGIYYYSPDDAKIPSLENILDKIALTYGFKYCPSGSYAEYLIGISSRRPINCICYTNGKIKRLNIDNKIRVLFAPSKRTIYSFKSKEIMIVTNYLLNHKQKISAQEKLKIKQYIMKASQEDFHRDYSLIPQIIRGYFPLSY